MANIINANFFRSTKCQTCSAYQYDYGQILKTNLLLPEAYEVQFSNTSSKGTAITQIGNSDGVSIPDQMFLNGSPIYAWIFLHTGEDDGETEYMITIPIEKRAKPTNMKPVPVQQDAITQAIAALNSAVEQTGMDVTDAAASASAALASEQAAARSAASAHNDAERAEQAANTAGYMDVEIVDGRLIYTRTDAVDVDFELENGHLLMEVI